MPRYEEAVVQVGGSLIEGWTSYRIDSDLLIPADAFDMSILVTGPLNERNRITALTKPGQPVRIAVDGALQLDGVIDQRVMDATEDGGTSIRITGRDRAAFLVDAFASLHVQVENERMVVRRRFITVPAGEYNLRARAPFIVDFPTLPAEERVQERVKEGVTLLDLIRAVVEPWGIPVVAEGTSARDILTGRGTRRSRAALRENLARAYGVPVEQISRAQIRRAEEQGGALGITPEARARSSYANRLTPDDIEKLRPNEARPQPGEKVWDFIARHTKRFGLMAWMAPDGRLIISSPNYEDAPAARFVRRIPSQSDDPNNTLAMTRRESIGETFSECTVYGRAPGGNARRSRFRSTEYDLDFPYFKPLVVHDQNVRSEEEARRRAIRELYTRRLNADSFSVRAPGHGQTELFAVNTIVEVVDEVTNVRASYYVLSRTFNKDASNGTTTDLNLIPKGALVL